MCPQAETLQSPARPWHELPIGNDGAPWRDSRPLPRLPVLGRHLDWSQESLAPLGCGAVFPDQMFPAEPNPPSDSKLCSEYRSIHPMESDLRWHRGILLYHRARRRWLLLCDKAALPPPSDCSRRAYPHTQASFQLIAGLLSSEDTERCCTRRSMPRARLEGLQR